MSRNFKIVLAVAAVVITSALAAVTNSFPVPFYVGIFYVGPFAFLWFLLPAVLVPLLLAGAIGLEPEIGSRHVFG